MSDISQIFYNELINLSQNLRESLSSEIGKVFSPRMLQQPDEINELCYEHMYRKNINKKEILPPDYYWNLIPGLEYRCNKCINFFTPRRSILSKQKDIIMGARFEQPFISFLKSKGLNVFEANKEINIKYPDLGIRNSDNRIVLFIEVKYHNAPFIKVKEKRNNNTECYDGSLSIDDVKVKRQLALVRKNYPGVRCVIAHWIDFPCLKCVLWGDIDSAIGGDKFIRQHREGDFVDGRKVGDTEKVYHYIKSLNDFKSLVILAHELMAAMIKS